MSVSRSPGALDDGSPAPPRGGAGEDRGEMEEAASPPSPAAPTVGSPPSTEDLKRLDMTASALSGSTAVPCGERALDIAELELRIRKFNLDLTQPSIRRCSLLELEIAEIRQEMRRNDQQISELSQKALKLDEQIVVIEGFRETMSKWDSERRQSQAQVAECLSSVKVDQDAFHYNLERKDAAIHSMQRTVDRVVGELQSLQEGSTSLREHLEMRLGQQSRVLNTTKADLEMKLISLETKHNRLSDELWGEATGLAKVTGSLSKTNDLVASLGEDMKRMQHDKANVLQLETVQYDVSELVREANNSMTTLKETVNTMVGDVKEHFRTATNTVAAHNATMLTEVRSSYQEELAHVAKLREDIVTFKDETQRQVHRVQHEVNISQQQADSTVKKVTSDLDELHRVRNREKSNRELLASTVQEQLHRVSSSSEAVAKGLEHLNNVMWIVLQSERASSALDMQDDLDRAKVALMGYGTSKTGPGGGARPRPRSKGGASSDHADHSGAGAAPVISVDNRCMSCSGQAQHVLSGFKMACLQYAPGSVPFAKKMYSRPELLDLRQKLLDQANDTLMQGIKSREGQDIRPQSAANFRDAHNPLPIRASPDESGSQHFAGPRKISELGDAPDRPPSSPSGGSTSVVKMPSLPVAQRTGIAGPVTVR